jgi:hypothetical protein
MPPSFVDYQLNKGIIYSTEEKPTFFNATRNLGDAVQAHRKPPSIFQLLDQLENVAEKLLAE